MAVPPPTYFVEKCLWFDAIHGVSVWLSTGSNPAETNRFRPYLDIAKILQSSYIFFRNDALLSKISYFILVSHVSYVIHATFKHENNVKTKELSSICKSLYHNLCEQTFFIFAQCSRLTLNQDKYNLWEFVMEKEQGPEGMCNVS